MVLLLSALSGAVPAAAQELSPPADARIGAIQARGALRVAITVEYPWLVRDGGPAQPYAGPAWTLIRDIAGRLGVRIEAVPVSLDDRIAALSRPDIDISAGPMLVTTERERMADFVSYSSSAQCLFGRVDDRRIAGAKGWDALDRPEVTIATIAGSHQDETLRARLPHARIIAVEGTLAEGPRAAVLDGRVDAGLIDKFFLARLTRTTPGLVSIPGGAACLDSREMEIPVGVAIARGQPGFLSWLRAIAGRDRKPIAAEQRRIISMGSGTG